MKLEEIGFTEKIAMAWGEDGLGNVVIGRVIAEHRERYCVKTERGDVEAEITGNRRFTANSRADFPAVGDWVTLTMYDNEFAVIQSIAPRFSTISRQAVGQFGEIQIIATNIDYALLMQAVDRDFNINRLERYLTICYASKVKPIIVLTKTDLISAADIRDIKESIQKRIIDVPVFAVSNETHAGYDELKNQIRQGKTYCMLGSSGVGKSTLLNTLSGRNIMKTDAISSSTSKGRHVTSHRELVVLESGGVLLDNPGMREVGIVDTADGLEITFTAIEQYAQRCKFTNCTHTVETGCAVLDAVEKGEVDNKSYTGYLKMEKEKAYFESTVAERRKKDKSFGKMIKNFKKVTSG